VVLVALCLVVPAVAFSQALTNLSSLRVGYNSRKMTLKPEGALKAHIDEIDQAIADATRLGRSAEIRRLIAKGQTLLAGREWTDTLDFSNSIVLRTEHVIADSTRPYVVRLEQIYTPSIELQRSLVAHAVLRKRPAPATGGATAPPGEVVKDLGRFDGVGRDLRDAPYGFELDVQSVPDGTYQLAVEVFDDTRALGAATLLINLRNGLDQVAARLEGAARAAPDNARADILYPVDRMRNVNRGRIELRTFDPDHDFAEAATIAAAVKDGKAPFAGRTGDFKRHYLLDAAGEVMPYRMYVP
jgi:hypothetical protein